MTSGTEFAQSRPQVWGSALAALALLIGSGAAYRIAAARLADVSGCVPLAPGTLAALPLTIGHWIGEDLPLTEAIVEATDTDDHVNRLYKNHGGPGAVALFIAYGVRFRDLAPHRPEVCYPGSGWTHQATNVIDLPLADGLTLPSQVHHFSRGVLDSEAITVLNYYIVDGRYCHDVSRLRSLAWRFEVDARYVAQIQIASSAGEFFDRSDELVHAFAADSAPVIRAMLEHAVAEATLTHETMAD